MGEEDSVREQFREAWLQVVNEMVRFGPALVLLSAGFDAHDEDPLACCDLLEEDFAWATELVMEACRCIAVPPLPPVPVVSVLEGGYHLGALASSALAHVQALSRGADGGEVEDSEREVRQVENDGETEEEEEARMAILLQGLVLSEEGDDDMLRALTSLPSALVAQEAEDNEEGGSEAGCGEKTEATGFHDLFSDESAVQSAQVETSADAASINDVVIDAASDCADR